MNGRPDPGWFLRQPSAAASARIFCFPYSGIGASMFNRWPRRFGAGSGGSGGIEVCPLQWPARENRIRVPHYGTYEALAGMVGPALLPHLDSPFILFGHCAGALPAFETARWLIQQGVPGPRRLVVSAQVAPHDCPHDRYLDYGDDRLSEELRALVIARGGQPHPLLIELTLDVLRADLAANRVYRLAEPQLLPVGLTVLRWRDDSEVSAAQMEGWRQYSQDVRFAVLDGDHYEFLRGGAALLRELAEGVRAAHVGS